MTSYRDLKSGQYRLAAFDGATLRGALFVAPQPVAVSRDWAVAQLNADMSGRARLGIIAARPGKGCSDRGATVCSCYGVGINDITAAIARGCSTVGQVGELTGAGTNCGSCRSEIRQIINRRVVEAAE